MPKSFRILQTFAAHLSATPGDFLRFRGRIDRSTYWWRSSIAMVSTLLFVGVVLGITGLAGHIREGSNWFTVSLLVCLLAILLANLITLPLLIRRVRDLDLPRWTFILMASLFMTMHLSDGLVAFRSWVFVPLMIAAGFAPAGYGRALDFRKSTEAK